MIECNLKDAGTIVDTKFANDSTSTKISVRVRGDNIITLSLDLATIMGLGSSPLEKKENTRGRSLWTLIEHSIVYTSNAMRRKLYQ